MKTKLFFLPSIILEICLLKILVLVQVSFQRHLEEWVGRKGFFFKKNSVNRDCPGQDSVLQCRGHDFSFCWGRSQMLNSAAKKNFFFLSLVNISCGLCIPFTDYTWNPVFFLCFVIGSESICIQRWSDWQPPVYLLALFHHRPSHLPDLKRRFSHVTSEAYHPNLTFPESIHEPWFFPFPSKANCHPLTAVISVHNQVLRRKLLS